MKNLFKIVVIFTSLGIISASDHSDSESVKSWASSVHPSDRDESCPPAFPHLAAGAPNIGCRQAADGTWINEHGQPARKPASVASFDEEDHHHGAVAASSASSGASMGANAAPALLHDEDDDDEMVAALAPDEPLAVAAAFSARALSPRVPKAMPGFEMIGARSAHATLGAGKLSRPMPRMAAAVASSSQRAVSSLMAVCADGSIAGASGGAVAEWVAPRAPVRMRLGDVDHEATVELRARLRHFPGRAAGTVVNVQAQRAVSGVPKRERHEPAAAASPVAQDSPSKRSDRGGEESPPSVRAVVDSTGDSGSFDADVPSRRVNPFAASMRCASDGTSPTEEVASRACQTAVPMAGAAPSGNFDGEDLDADDNVSVGSQYQPADPLEGYEESVIAAAERAAAVAETPESAPMTPARIMGLTDQQIAELPNHRLNEILRLPPESIFLVEEYMDVFASGEPDAKIQAVMLIRDRWFAHYQANAMDF